MIVGILALSQALESLAILLGVGTGANLDWIARMLAGAGPGGLLLALLVIGGLAPVGEELFFRGFMLARLRLVWSAGPAILVTAIAFGVIHGEWVHGVLATGIGIYLGLVTRAVRQRDPGGDLPRGQQHGLRAALGRDRFAAGARRERGAARDQRDALRRIAALVSAIAARRRALRRAGAVSGRDRGSRSGSGDRGRCRATR